jgi:predicted metal-dependent hydrolase
MAGLIQLDDPETVVAVRRSGQARRMTLSVPQNGDPPRLTVPNRATDPDIRMFLLRQADWLRAALQRAPELTVVGSGTLIPVAGRFFTITQTPGPRRPPYIDEDRLIVPGAADAGPRVAAWLKERARAALAPIAQACAAEVGGSIGRISLRDTKGRWGSCTSRGDLSFSWRLAMAPAEVLDYVAAHEAAHLIEMNHGPRFWALVTQLRPDWKRQRDWLRRDGSALHRFRFKG